MFLLTSELQWCGGEYEEGSRVKVDFKTTQLHNRLLSFMAASGYLVVQLEPHLHPGQ